MAATLALGLAFAIALSDGGKSVPIDRFTLKVPGEKGALVLTLEGAELVGGAFVAPVRLANETDADVLAVKIDLVSVTETRRDGGGGRGSTRPVEASASPPPAWDLIGKGTDAAGRLFRASPVAFSPETTLVVILGAVSGVVAAGSFEVAGAESPVDVAVDQGGYVHVADASGKVLRVAPDRNTVVETSWPAEKSESAPEAACASHRAAGRVCRAAPDGSAWVIEDCAVSVFDREGRRVRSFPPGGEGPPVALAVGKDGRLYVATAGEAGRGGSVRVFRPF